ncbi:MAG TPA: glycosyltransferase family 4 protein [Chitinophagaceae bacterium]
MPKLKLGIVNITSMKMSYGGIAPFVKNLDPYMQEAYDVDYIVLPEFLVRISIIPQRFIFLVYMLWKKRRLKRFDFILSHTPEGSYVTSFCKVPFIHIFHGNSNPMSRSRYWYGKYFSSVYEMIDKRIRSKAIRMYTVGVEKQGVSKIFNPVLHSVKIKDKSARSGFIFSGRLENVKNIDRLIRIYANLPECVQNENLFYIAGTGTLASALKKQVTSLGLSDRIIFLGELKNEDMIEANSTKKILLMASSLEGMPMAIAEALSVGIPVVSTDVGDIARIIRNQENGFLLPLDYEDEEYLQCINSILSDYTRFADNAFATSEVFRSEKVASSLISDINQLAQKN